MIPAHFRQIRSYVKRDSRTSLAQKNAIREWGEKYILPIDAGVIDLNAIFPQPKPCLIEIGFGMGNSLIAAAMQHPDKNFIGIETHKPGIGAVIANIEKHQLHNLRVFYGDSVLILKNVIANASLAGAQIFFPDPWPKRKHNIRRLVQTEFVQLITDKLQMNGTLHLATDWEDYAIQMLRVVSQQKNLFNLSGEQQFSERSLYRPIITKFETRAMKEGRKIFDIQLQKIIL